jgi:hypothetical protein
MPPEPLALSARRGSERQLEPESSGRATVPDWPTVPEPTSVPLPLAGPRRLLGTWRGHRPPTTGTPRQTPGPAAEPPGDFPYRPWDAEMPPSWGWRKTPGEHPPHSSGALPSEPGLAQRLAQTPERNGRPPRPASPHPLPATQPGQRRLQAAWLPTEHCQTAETPELPQCQPVEPEPGQQREPLSEATGERQETAEPEGGRQSASTGPVGLELPGPARSMQRAPLGSPATRSPHWSRHRRHEPRPARMPATNGLPQSEPARAVARPGDSPHRRYCAEPRAMARLVSHPVALRPPPEPPLCPGTSPTGAATPTPGRRYPQCG